MTHLRPASAFLLDGEAPPAQRLGDAKRSCDATAKGDASPCLRRDLPGIDDGSGAVLERATALAGWHAPRLGMTFTCSTSR